MYKTFIYNSILGNNQTITAAEQVTGLQNKIESIVDNSNFDELNYLHNLNALKSIK